MRILKFGGTSMVDENSWRRVLDIITRYENPVVVVSATARTTRQLVSAAEVALTDLSEGKNIARAIGERHKNLVINFLVHAGAGRQVGQLERNCMQWIDSCIANLNERLVEIKGQNEISPKQKDAIASVGEQLSARLFATCGRAYGLRMEWIDARSVIKTDSTFGRAQPDLNKIVDSVSTLQKKNAQNVIPVVGGFYGEDRLGNITTLGFEGSDYTAALIGGALQAETIEIWTDVNGVFTCDPRVVPSARPIAELSFQDAAELANYGAKVLHPFTMKPASSNEIPIFVKNIFEADHPGTKIHHSAARSGWARAMAFIEDVVLISANTANKSIRDHRMVEVFAILEEYQSSIITIITNKKVTSVVVRNFQGLDDLEAKLKAVSTITKRENQSIISLIGCVVSGEEELRDRIASVLAAEPPLLVYNKQEKVGNIVVDENEAVSTVKLLHRHIFE